jgi:hypothetical protein
MVDLTIPFGRTQDRQIVVNCVADNYDHRCHLLSFPTDAPEPKQSASRGEAYRRSGRERILNG